MDMKDMAEADASAHEEARKRMWWDWSDQQVVKGKVWDSALDLPSTFVYHCQATGLVFQWDGDVNHPVEVLHVEDEDRAIVWRFWFNDHKHPRMVAVGFRSAVTVFQAVCDTWTETTERRPR